MAANKRSVLALSSQSLITFVGESFSSMDYLWGKHRPPLQLGESSGTVSTFNMTLCLNSDGVVLQILVYICLPMDSIYIYS